MVAVEGNHWDRHEVQLRLKLDRKLNITLRSKMWGDEEHLDTIMRNAGDIADKIDEIRRRCEELKALLAEVQTAAKREIAKGRKRGIAYQYVSAEPAPIEVGSSDGFAVRLSIGNLDHSLRTQRVVFALGSAADCLDTFRQMAEEQTLRAQARAYLECCGATSQIDAVVVHALRDAGVDMADVIQLLRDDRAPVVDIAAGDHRIPIYWKNGTLYSHVELDGNTSWSEGTLTFRKAPQSLGPKYQGKLISAIYVHPFIDEQTTAFYCSGDKGEYGMMSCVGRVYQFDLESGRIWHAVQPNELSLAA